jgi:serine/threonine protein phosphatase PrpC
LNNEDLPLIDAARGIFGVIDGIGGQAGGEVAAATAKDVILQRLARPLGTPAERVREAIAIANNEIHRRAEHSGELRGMACVVTLAMVNDGRITVGHVGDTRLYKMRADRLRKLTRDHSPVGEREDAGEISEIDAMRHPRRHEIFRDVGSVYRDKDEQEFVDVVEETLERDSAILLCSDGLTDMLPASAIAHIIRQHAGSPERVVETLVAAANDAGGRDNVTVVYAEMPDFAPAAGHLASDDLAPTEPLIDGAAPSSDDAAATAPDGAGRVRLAIRAIVRSRTTWFVAGMLIGVVGALMLTLYVARMQVRAPQTLVVASDGSARFQSIQAAIDAARPGDTVRVEPGIYREFVQVRDGIDLLARVPWSVTIERPPGMGPAVPGLSIAGALNVRVSGIRVTSTLEQPGDVGIRVACPGATLELVEIVGSIRQAISLLPASAVTVQGSRIAVTGTVIAVPDDGHAIFTNTILSRVAGATGPAITAGPLAHVVLRGNVLIGYGAAIVTGVSDARRQELLDGNVVITSSPGGGRGSERRR